MEEDLDITNQQTFNTIFDAGALAALLALKNSIDAVPDLDRNDILQVLQLEITNLSLNPNIEVDTDEKNGETTH